MLVLLQFYRSTNKPNARQAFARAENGRGAQVWVCSGRWAPKGGRERKQWRSFRLIARWIGRELGLALVSCFYGRSLPGASKQSPVVWSTWNCLRFRTQTEFIIHERQHESETQKE